MMRGMFAAYCGRTPVLFIWAFVSALTVALVVDMGVIESLAIAVAAPVIFWLIGLSGIGPGYWWIVKPWKKNRAFAVEHYAGDDLGALSVGGSEFQVYIEPRYATVEMGWVEVRLVKRDWPRFWRYRAIEESAVCLHSVQPRPRPGEQVTITRNEQVNGWRCNFVPPLRRGPAYRLNFSVLIQAYRPEKCKISFEYVFDEFGRGYGRHKVQVS